MPDPTQASIRFTDLSPRMVVSTTVVASPTDATETIIASITIPSGLVLSTGVILAGWAAYTTGTAATAGRLRVRRTNVSGTVVADTGAMTGGHNSAGLLVADDVNGFDTSPADAQVYKLTLTVSSASAGSAVSGVLISAIAV